MSEIVTSPESADVAKGPPGHPIEQSGDVSPTKRRKLCSSCGDDMPADANVCRQCRSFQGWRWWVRLAGVSLPWFSALVAILYFGANEYKSLQPLKQKIYIFSEVFHDHLKIDLFSNYEHEIYIIGSFFVCNLIKNPDRQNYVSVNITDRMAVSDTGIAPGTRHNFEITLPADAVSALRDKSKFCQLSFILNDYEGQSDIFVMKPLDIDTIKFDGKFVSPVAAAPN